MDSKKVNEQFELVYKSKIEPNIHPLEAERQKIKKILGISFILVTFSIIFSIFCANISVLAQAGLMTYAIFFFILVIFGSLIVITPLKKKYRKNVKNKLLMGIFSIFGNFYYADKEVISLKEIKKNGLYKNAVFKKDDDVIVGKYKDIEISITETKLFHKSGKSEVTDYSGLILRIKMNKNFEGHTVVRQRPMSYEQFLNNFRAFQAKNSELVPKESLKFVESPVLKFAFKGMQLMKERDVSFSKEEGLSFSLGQNISISSKGLEFHSGSKYEKNPKNLEKVVLEDSEFNQIFDIFSDNQVEARYLLTPSFMERLKNISVIMLVMDVHCIFKDGYMTLFLGSPLMLQQVSNRGFFELEPENGKTLYDKKIYEKVFKELITLFDFIYHFKLDQKIGL